MQLMRRADVPLSPAQRVFRHSPARAVLVVLVIAAAIAVLLMVGWQQKAGLAYYLAGVLLLGTLILRRLVLARFQPSNWLVRMDEQGLFLQFRSYLNHRFSEADLTVVYIPHDHIRSLALVEDRIEVPYRDVDRPLVDKSAERHRRLVEMELSGGTEQLAQAIADERARRPAGLTLYKDYPVRVSSPTRLQLDWRVQPRAEVFLDAMRAHAQVGAVQDQRRDTSQLQGKSRDEQDAFLLELIDAGQTIDAIYLARKLYAFNLSQARGHIEALRRGSAHT